MSPVQIFLAVTVSSELNERVLGRSRQTDTQRCKSCDDKNEYTLPNCLEACRSCSGVMANIKSLSDLNGDDGDDKGKFNDYYAGGEKRSDTILAARLERAALHQLCCS